MEPSVVDLALNDEELSKLPFGSDEFKAALARKQAGKMDENDDVSADDEDEKQEEVAEDDESQDDDEKVDEQPKKKARGLLKRVEELTAIRRDLERQLEEAKVAKPEGTKEEQSDDPTERLVKETIGEFEEEAPRFKDFDSVDEFQDARDEYNRRKWEHEQQQGALREHLAKARKDFESSWETKAAVTRETFEDYDEVVTVQAIAAVKPSQEARAFVAESDIGTTLIYTILADEDEAESFAKLSPTRQVARLAVLEKELQGDEEEAKPTRKTTTSRAPTPPKKMPKGSLTSSIGDPVKDADKMSDDEWNRAYEAAMARKRRK
jgi:hypothetical protein